MFKCFAVLRVAASSVYYYYFYTPGSIDLRGLKLEAKTNITGG